MIDREGADEKFRQPIFRRLAATLTAYPRFWPRLFAWAAAAFWCSGNVPCLHCNSLQLSQRNSTLFPNDCRFNLHLPMVAGSLRRLELPLT
jgi:hypothetical protein